MEEVQTVEVALKSFKQKLLNDSNNFDIFTAQIDKYMAFTNEYLTKINGILVQFPKEENK